MLYGLSYWRLLTPQLVTTETRNVRWDQRIAGYKVSDQEGGKWEVFREWEGGK